MNTSIDFQIKRKIEAINPPSKGAVTMISKITPLLTSSKMSYFEEEIPISVINLTSTSPIRNDEHFLEEVTEKEEIFLFKDMVKTKLCHNLNNDFNKTSPITIFYGAILYDTLYEANQVGYGYIVIDCNLSLVEIYPITKGCWEGLTINHSYLENAFQYSMSKTENVRSDTILSNFVNDTENFNYSIASCNVKSCILLSKVDTNLCYKNIKYNVVLPVLTNFRDYTNISTRYATMEGSDINSREQVYNIEPIQSSEMFNIYVKNNIIYNFMVNNPEDNESCKVNTKLISINEEYQLSESTRFLKYNYDILISLLHYYFEMQFS